MQISKGDAGQYRDFGTAVDGGAEVDGSIAVLEWIAVDALEWMQVPESIGVD